MRLIRSVSFKLGSYVSMHLTYQGNLVGHVMSWAGQTVEVLGIIKVDKTSMTDEDGKVLCIDDVIYCCRMISNKTVMDIPGEDLKKPTASALENALSLLISKGEIQIHNIPSFGENVFKPFKFRR